MSQCLPVKAGRAAATVASACARVGNCPAASNKQKADFTCCQACSWAHQSWDCLAVRGGVEVSLDGLGLTVDGLSAKLVFLRQPGDRALVAQPGGGRAGDTLAKG